MRIIGLTGSIACGKSTVSNYLASKGCPVVDGDKISRELTAPGSPVLPVLHEAFGSEVFYEDGTLNRRRLGRVVFSDASALSKLDHLMAPYLQTAIHQRIKSVESSGAPVCFLDMPLLFEKGYDRLCDTVWCVWLPEKVQLSRLMERDGYTMEEALGRIRSVLSSDEKAARSDRVIDNTGPLDQTFETVSGLLSEELNHTVPTPRPRRVNTVVSEAASPVPPAPVPAVSHLAPDIMERPEASRVGRKQRKVSWRLPVWLKISLISSAAILLIGFTALMLMNGFLHNCELKHISEQNSIDRHYPIPAEYQILIERYAKEYNLSPAFVAAVILNESSFQPRNTSSVGARGLMQLMPDTAEWIAGKLKIEGYSFERMYDPESNILFGCWYLNYLSRLFAGDPVSVTAAYHAGQGQVKVWLSDPNRSEDGYSLSFAALPEGPTKTYTGRVTRDYGIYQKKYYSADVPAADSDAADAGL